MTTSVIRDVTFNYPKLINPHSPFGTEQWDIQVVTSSESTKDQLESLGVKMKKGDQGFYTNIKRKAIKKDGQPMDAPKVLDENKEEMSKDKVMKLGNGSKGHLKVFTYDWSVGGRSGTSSMLVAIQVTDYVEYASAGEDF